MTFFFLNSLGPMGSTQNLAALGQPSINGNPSPLAFNGPRPPIPFTSPASNIAPPISLQNYPPLPPSNYPAVSTQQNPPPPTYPPQQSFPPPRNQMDDYEGRSYY